MDSDRIMVLDQGQVAEFDTPANLLADPRSIFYSLARNSLGMHKPLCTQYTRNKHEAKRKSIQSLTWHIFDPTDLTYKSLAFSIFWINIQYNKLCAF